jgi:hypothetical protein
LFPGCAELERLMPKERAALVKANVVYEIDQVRIIRSMAS